MAQPPTQQAAAQTSLDALFAACADYIDNIINYIEPILPDIEDEPITGPIYNKLLQDDKLEMCTNYTPSAIVDLVQQMQPYVALAARQDPKPKSPTVDALICYLTWAKVRKQFKILAKLLGMKTGHFEDNVNCIHSIINTALKEKWWEHRAHSYVIRLIFQMLL
jgi:hypothetical protein